MEGHHLLNGVINTRHISTTMDGWDHRPSDKGKGDMGTGGGGGFNLRRTGTLKGTAPMHAHTAGRGVRAGSASSAASSPWTACSCTEPSSSCVMHSLMLC